MRTSGSIQRWLTVAALLAVGVSVGLSGLFVERTVSERMVTEAERSLERVLRIGAARAAGDARMADREGSDFASVIQDSTIGQFAWLVEAEKPSRSTASEPAFVELARTKAFPESFSADLRSTELLPSTVQFEVIVGANGETYRTASFVFQPGRERPGGPPRGEGPPQRDFGPGRGRPRGPDPDETLRVSVATSIGDERAFLKILVRTLLLAGLLAIGLSALLIPWAVRRGLRPVRQISDEIGRMDADRLDQALDVAAPPAELAPIVQSFESARERLSEAFVREKRFSSDAAHELRTPLAGLRASLEVALRRERSQEHYRTTMSECLGITESMQGMVESLLLLAKGAERELERTSVDLGAVLEDTLAKRTEELSARRLRVRSVPGAGPTIHSAQVLVERIFTNILCNAAQYADEGSAIECSLETGPESVSFCAVNETSNLQAETAERAFDPLWRGDAARTDASLHAGLGLSIVKQCVDVLGGTVSVTAEGHRFTITVRLPLSSTGS